ncbi:MAG: imidazole glycerol phosphate synthase subunit HisH [Desulfobacterales bacterium]|nr:imidazole glycerol phosphate synthase subunit HisH [Desulfobacterales bacterium]
MIAIVDYKAGNLKSVELAVNRLGFPCRITQDKRELLDSERIIFPGVGAAGKAMNDLRQLALDEFLRQAFEDGKPILGICLGAQIILGRSQENNSECLGLIEGDVKQFPPTLGSDRNENLKIPHMGWNGVRLVRRHPVLEGMVPTDEFYFVHSYYPKPASDKYIIGITDYGMEFSSIIGYKGLIATQFHLEKSGAPGLRILNNFCTWNGHYAE